jgi:hypothetical protein
VRQTISQPSGLPMLDSLPGWRGLAIVVGGRKNYF